MTKKLITLLFLLTSLTPFIYGQIHVNPGIDTADHSIKAAIKFYSNYILAFKGKKLPDFNKYWSEEACKKYSVPDPSVYGIGGDYPTYAMVETKTIHYVRPMKDGIINIKMTGGWLDSLKNHETMYITNHYIKTKGDGTLQFITPIEYHQKNWRQKKLATINFRYPKYHHFNHKKAKQLIKQINDLEQQWNLTPIPIDYYFADTYDEIQLIRGFDFTIGMGNVDKPMGISNQTDRIVYCAGNGENYFHEVVHIYLNPLHPKSPLNEGLATFYGGSLGKPITWHISRLKDYLNKHPEINLDKLSDFYYMDNFTNPNSAIQGMLCQLVFDKEGITGLKRLMTYTTMNEVFEKEFKLNTKELNTELRKLINSR